MRAAVFAALFVLAAACGGARPVPSGGAPSPAPSPASCLSARFPFPTPGAEVLTAADSGRTVSVAEGALVEVTLLGRDAPDGRWPELTIQGGALKALPNPAQSATVGTQLGELCAVRPGEAVLSSGGWTVRVDVRGPVD